VKGGTPVYKHLLVGTTIVAEPPVGIRLSIFELGSRLSLNAVDIANGLFDIKVPLYWFEQSGIDIANSPTRMVQPQNASVSRPHQTSSPKHMQSVSADNTVLVSLSSTRDYLTDPATEVVA
jgi:hypothetical protein